MTIGSARAALAPLAALIALALIATPAAAQIYKYKDASGRMVVSDKPPPGKAPRKPAPLDEPSAETPPPAPVAQEGKPASDPKLEAKRKEQEARQKAEADEKQRAYEKQMKEFCSEAKRHLAALESGQRVARYNQSTGEREFLEDDQRSEEIARVRQKTSECK